jgi:hypothetical protein
MTKQTIKRRLKLLGLVHRHSRDCYGEIKRTIAENGGLPWREIISKHMQKLVEETDKVKK